MLIEVWISTLVNSSILSFWEWIPVIFYAWGFPSSKLSHFYHGTLNKMFVHYSMQSFPPGPRRVSENSHTLGKFGRKSESGQALQTSLAPELTSNKPLEEEALILQVSMTAGKTRFSSVLFVVQSTFLGFIESKIRAPVCLFFLFMYVKACTFNYK